MEAMEKRNLDQDEEILKLKHENQTLTYGIQVLMNCLLEHKDKIDETIRRVNTNMFTVTSIMNNNAEKIVQHTAIVDQKITGQFQKINEDMETQKDIVTALLNREYVLSTRVGKLEMEKQSPSSVLKKGLLGKK